MRESDHYSQSHAICIDQCLPFEETRTKRTATRSGRWTFVSFLRLVKVHATRPNKQRESDDIAVAFGAYAHKREQLARAQL